LQNRIFDRIYEVKRMQPGKLKLHQVVESYGKQVNSITHDCSTLGNNSGSAIIKFSASDPQSPVRAIGLHFAEEHLKANYAVSMFDLSQDSRVVDAGVNFVGRVVHFDAVGDALGGIESIAAATLQGLTSAPGAPIMTKAEFDQLRARLLAERAQRGSMPAVESLETQGLEGIIPSFRDHSPEQYLAKLGAKTA